MAPGILPPDSPWNDAEVEFLVTLDHLYPRTEKVRPSTRINKVIVTSISSGCRRAGDRPRSRLARGSRRGQSDRRRRRVGVTRRVLMQGCDAGVGHATQSF